MRHRITSVVILLAAIVGFAEGPDGLGASRPSDPEGLVVHEWGTFTSVAAEDGAAVEWVPPQGPRDLPCFVDRVLFNIKGWLPATVRMETPVVYFYSTEEKTVDVRVRFRKGIVTEWYPRAAVTPTAIETTTLRKPDAGRHDSVEPGQDSAARQRELSRRERQQPLLRGAQDRRVSHRSANRCRRCGRGNAAA